jgi:hypothetical protein
MRRANPELPIEALDVQRANPELPNASLHFFDHFAEPGIGGFHQPDRNSLNGESAIREGRRFG